MTEVDLSWMYVENPEDEAAEEENKADEAAARFDERLQEHLYGGDEF